MTNISVIIPNYNHGKYLESRLESILHQTYNKFELIILDDASTDDSRTIIESFRNNLAVSNILLSNRNSKSPFNQWSKGILAARYEWIWIAESDDFALPTFLEEAAKTIAENPLVSMIICNSNVEENNTIITTTAAISKQLLHTEKWENSYWSSGIEEINTGLKYFSNFPNASAVVFRKDLAINYLKKLKDFRYCGDWFMYISILQNNPIIYYNHKCLNVFRRTSESHSVIHENKRIAIKKKELFHIFKTLYRIKTVKDKKKLLNWFIRNHIGLGFKSEGILIIIRSIVSYLIIDLKLTIKFLIARILFKFEKEKLSDS